MAMVFCLYMLHLVFSPTFKQTFHSNRSKKWKVLIFISQQWIIQQGFGAEQPNGQSSIPYAYKAALPVCISLLFFIGQVPAGKQMMHSFNLL